MSLPTEYTLFLPPSCPMKWDHLTGTTSICRFHGRLIFIFQYGSSSLSQLSKNETKQ